MIRRIFPRSITFSTRHSPPCQESKRRKKEWLNRKFILSSAMRENTWTKHCENVVLYRELFGVMVIIIKILSEQLHVHVENAGPHLECLLTKVALRLGRRGNLDLINLQSIFQRNLRLRLNGRDRGSKVLSKNMSHLADHITIVLLCGKYAGSLKLDN